MKRNENLSLKIALSQQYTRGSTYTGVFISSTDIPFLSTFSTIVLPLSALINFSQYHQDFGCFPHTLLPFLISTISKINHDIQMTHSQSRSQEVTHTTAAVISATTPTLKIVHVVKSLHPL